MRATAARDNESSVADAVKGWRPVVKWAGGKKSLSQEIVACMPSKIGTYAEPFCGGAAVFFALASEPKRRFERAVLADKNEELVRLYRALQRDVDKLVGRLGAYQDDHYALTPEERRQHYYDVRERSTKRLGDVERGARLLFLNKTCFNGLWRVNARGKFNVPFGRYEKPRILDEKRLREAHEALAGVAIVHDDFQAVTKDLVRGDFVYFDPPYVPLSKTANFTAYAADRFDAADQQRLADELKRLADCGVRAMLSNACSPETKSLYAAFRNRKVPMKRAINSDAAKRGAVDELLVMNYALSALP